MIARGELEIKLDGRVLGNIHLEKTADKTFRVNGLLPETIYCGWRSDKLKIMLSRKLKIIYGDNVYINCLGHVLENKKKSF